MIINNKEYQLNIDGTPTFQVYLSLPEDKLIDSIKIIKKYYTFEDNNLSKIKESEIFIADFNNCIDQHQQKYEIMEAYQSNIKIILFCCYDNELIKKYQTFKAGCDLNIKAILYNDDEFQKSVRSEIAKHSYGLKLKSDAWKDLTSEAIEKAEGKCQICNSRYKIRVHHRDYKRQGTLDEIDDLIVVCEYCHEIVHKHCMNENKRNVI